MAPPFPFRVIRPLQHVVFTKTMFLSSVCLVTDFVAMVVPLDNDPALKSTSIDAK